MPEPIGSYALLGDTRSAALVSEQGSVDWLCIPRFDGMPIFGSLIDPAHGGQWFIKSRGARVTERAYTEGAASVRTVWKGPQGAVAVTDGLIGDTSSHLMPRLALVRHVRCLSGRADVEVLCDPRLGLPGRPPRRTRHDDHVLIAMWGSIALSFSCDRPLALRPGELRTFSLVEGEEATLVMGLAYREPLILVPAARGASLLLDDDRWWRAWLRRFDYNGPHQATIERSLLTLRLLTYAPSGAPVAAVTTSIPAPPESDQAWDYRFSWPRDASIGIGAFLEFGSKEEPSAFLQWFVNASRTTRPCVDVLYDLDGRPVRKEEQIAGVAGYDAGAPVRVGNAAASQTQLDVYGWILDASWGLHRAGQRLTAPQWRAARSFARYIAKHWAEPDNGIWEERRAPQHYVHSKLMAWVGLDRACRLAEEYPAKGAERAWRRHRDALAGAIRARGFNPAAGSYRREFDRDDVDASLLAVADMGFDEDPQPVNGTIDAVRRQLGAGGALLYRYHRPDGLTEGAFLPCSFWLVHALARMHRLDEAEEAFDELCSLASPLGLYAEQIDPATRQPMGNFPQAFSHATFLRAAAALNAARETSQGSGRKSRGQRARQRVSGRRS